MPLLATNIRPASSSGRLRRGLLALAVLLALAPPVASAQESGGSGQQHMLWTVASEDGQTQGYLVGSMHLMKEDAYPLAAAYDEAFAAADVAVFELNVDSAQAQAQQLIGRLGVYPGDETLESELDAETYQLLQARADSLGMSLAQMQKLEPWVLSILVPAAQMQRAGYTGASGIDRHFFDKAKEAGKTRVALETPAEQFGFFDNLSPEQQETFLRYGLQEASRNLRLVDEMAAAWKAGNAERLEELVQDEMQQEFPDFYETFIVERNENWMPQITELLASEERPLIVVGAGHVVGEDGLVAMLREEGYTVKQQ